MALDITTARGACTGERYLARLKDDREVWLHGERVDVTTHQAFAGMLHELARLKETRTPEVLTVNGRAEVVIQDAESYQELLDRLHHLETLAAIREGIASAACGVLKPAEQVFAEMQARCGLHD